MIGIVPRIVLQAVALAAIALTFLACSRADPGISQEKAEAVLKAFDYTEIELQTDPNGWSGTAIPENGGYWMRATVDRNGLMQLQPCNCGGLPSRAELLTGIDGVSSRPVRRIVLVGGL